MRNNMERSLSDRLRVWVDVGGTFTDWIAHLPDGNVHSGKVLSSSTTKGSFGGQETVAGIHVPMPTPWANGFWNGYRFRALDGDGAIVVNSIVTRSDGETQRVFFGEADSSDRGFSKAATWELCSPEPSPVFAIRLLLGVSLASSLPAIDLCLGTTRGTNALLTRRGARAALVTTAGFGDLLRIGGQDRPHLFELTVRKPSVLFETSIEIDERMAADGTVLRRPDSARVLAQLRELKQQGIQSLGICLLHGFRFGEHERMIAGLAREAGFEEISLSCEVAPLIRMVPRGETTVLDAFLNPVIRNYCDQILKSLSPDSSLQLLTSAGTLVPRERFSGKDSVLSGPAGGVVGFARVAQVAGFDRAIGFDMGGTSTDVARFDGEFAREYETRKAGIRILTPVMAIETVAAGGGSICSFDGVRLRVGPDSAGADPGPACYGSGGPLTVTDLNLLLGRISTDQFPFRLDLAAAERRIDELRNSVRASSGKKYERAELAGGLLDIANHSMAMAINTVSVQKGFDPADHVLVAFGGAGSQHATNVAQHLRMNKILIHPQCSMLSAVGIGHSERAAHEVESVLQILDEKWLATAETLFNRLAERATQQLRGIGFQLGNDKRTQAGSLCHVFRNGLDLRFTGTEPTIHITQPADNDWSAAFLAAHQKLYGYVQHRPIEIVSARVQAIIPGESWTPTEIPEQTTTPTVFGTTELFCRSESGEMLRVTAQQFAWDKLVCGDRVEGPAMIVNSTTTVIVEPRWDAVVLGNGSLLMTRMSWHRLPACETDESQAGSLCHADDPVTVEIFNHCFGAIARQMGITLQQTSISVNIRDRLDFSCAVFSADGKLVVNAPHIPVHLGSMGESVRSVIAANSNVVHGDVFVTNHPYRGGSHLPDITVVTPVYVDGHEQPDFWVASRGHHAEIGGKTPGSMPPDAKTLADEGVLIDNLKVIDAGQDRIDLFEKLITESPLPTRAPADNIADLRAQIAANRMGANELVRLVGEHSLAVVQQMMESIRAAARRTVEMRLAKIPDGEYSFSDAMDTGAKICVRITKKHAQKGSDPLGLSQGLTPFHPEAGNECPLRIDFSGTDPVQPDNLNANRGIVAAATMYVLRCLLDYDIPLNDGILEPVEIVIPEGCFLNPVPHEDAAKCPAIVGGNVETSQRVVDVLLGALGIAAASQGTMNNWLMGGDGFGYYETLGGGTGATADGPGADAVHSHMSNTRLTDPEVLETRYPVRLVECRIRTGSGGAGKHAGGNGMVRAIDFLKPLTVSLLTSRRTTQPYGINGGGSGASGVNTWIRADGTTETLSFRTAIQAQPGDQLKIETPGGGAWGSSNE